MSFQQPTRGLVTVKTKNAVKYASLYNGDSWIQRDDTRRTSALDQIRIIAEEKGIKITKIVEETTRLERITTVK
jgi:hypothetical protein